MYEGTPIKMGAIYSPYLGLAAIGGALALKRINVKIIDLNKFSEGKLISFIKDFNPDYIGISFTTPLAEEAFRLATLAKNIKKDIIVIGGGAHPSAMPRNVLESSDIDIVCVGEGDYSIVEVITGKPYKDIRGIAYKDVDGCHICEKNEFIKDLDNLAFPAWNLFNLSEYKTTRLIARKNPAGWLETSRGCPYGCVYCSKEVFGRNFREKSAQRVVDEMEYMLACGFREIHIADDCFTFNLERAKDICNKIIQRGLKFPWATVTGIRADRVDYELLSLMKKAGCYRVYYGIESGDDKVLKLINKGETCNVIRRAVKISKQAGLEVFGFFMLALPGETEETMRNTINFAKELDLDMAKMAITIPLPATPYFQDLYNSGRIKETNWSKYNLYFSARDLFEHPTLNWDTIEDYYKRFYRELYLRPKFIAKRFVKSLSQGNLLSDINSFLKTNW